MPHTDSLSSLVKNLELLAGSFDSISDFCERIDVNRQQFNKYLAGRHHPSQKVLAKIARYFHMEPSDLLRMPADFKAFYEGIDREPPNLLRFPRLLGLMDAADGNQAALARYHGMYYRYHCSSIMKGKVLRSVTTIFERDGRTLYRTVERFPMSNGLGGSSWFSFVYHGFCVLLGDRMFMLDFESKQKNELTFSVLTPQHRTPARFLYGLVTGVASTSFRQPFSARVALMREGAAGSWRSHLRSCQILAADDPSIPAEIAAYLRCQEGGVMLGGEG
ncbi:helix-turn-helix domain-containing protein [Comamonas sp. MYb396]|uniref:helix-turn-helix domain-containing protein n=1 Tax=Comamonas sp. MYb396 TaxID=2745302 RepID=UPI003094A513